MKGITGHRVHDAYANMAISPQGQVRPRPQTPSEVSRGSEDAAQVKISAGARQLAEGRGSSDPARVEALREKVALGPTAFDPQIVAEKLAAEFSGIRSS